MNSSTPLRVITVGHVDHGKSTLLGRLLYDTDSLSDQQKTALQLAEVSECHQTAWASLLDAFLEEQVQNITIDTTQLVFRTSQRSYVMIDAPGHQEFLKNMIAGATRADAALLIVDVSEGIREQTEQHLQLLSLLAIKQIVVLINKMDLVDREPLHFARATKEIEQLFRKYEIIPQQTIPIVARSGENIVTSSSKMNWYQGPTLLEALEKMKSTPSLENEPLRFMIQDVYRFDERRLIVGRVESGTLHEREEIIFWPGQKKSRVRSIEQWGVVESPKSASAGSSIAITLEDPLFVERGYLGGIKSKPPCEGHEIRTRLFWLDQEPLSLHQVVILQLGTQSIEGRVATIATLKKEFADQQILNPVSSSVTQHNIADVVFDLTRPMVYDHYEEIGAMGRFAIVVHERLGGGGVILDSKMKNLSSKSSEVTNTPVALSNITDALNRCVPSTLCSSRRSAILQTGSKSDHLTWNVSTIDREMRSRRFGHLGGILWLTGLSGSGKSTVAGGLETLLHQRGMATVMLDGDNLRHGLCADLGFSLQDRSENIRRTGEVAKLFAEAGLITITALISPFSIDRERVRLSCLQDGIFFKEIFVDAPLEVCEARDPRGLYQKARRGEIDHFTGISSPYEIPITPDVHLLTANSLPKETINQLYEIVLTWIGKGSFFQT